MDFAKTMRVRLTLQEEMLGTSPADTEVYDNFIASNAPDALSRKEEIAAIGVGDVAEKGRTVFPRLDDGRPFVYDYQIRGMFKDACGMLKKVAKSESSKMKAYKKNIDGLIFVFPRKIPVVFKGGVGDCQRPLRAQTMQGERVTLASSDTVPAGATLEFEVKLLDAAHEKSVLEWLDYGQYRGLGQWRNSGKGKYLFDILDKDGNVIGGNCAEELS